MLKKRGSLASIFFIIFVISLIFSYAFVITCSGHECLEIDCNICYEMNLMKSLFDDLLILSLIFVFINKVINYIREKNCSLEVKYNLTPVKLKVKLSE